MRRREFLRNASSTGLLFAFQFPRTARAFLAPTSSPEKSLRPNAFLELLPEGSVQVWCGRSEMGQGVRTSLPMIVAEELGCDWNCVRVVQADLDPKYGDQLTGGSLSVRTLYQNLRKAGAAAREVLVAAAAAEWNVDAASCRAVQGQVIHSPSGRKLAFHELIPRASEIPPPKDPALKPVGEFSLVGKPVRRTDAREKSTGQAVFGMDVRVPGMLIASVERCPVFEGRVRRFSAEKALQLPGVREVLEVKPLQLSHQFGDESGPGNRNHIRAGVAILADTTWAAMQARKALAIEWDEIEFANESSATLREQFVKRLETSGTILRNDGHFERAFTAGAKKLEAVYEVPFLAHATMEPMNCTAHVHDGQCELWAPTQIPGAAAESISKALGIAPEKIRVHVTFLGGGFGRRLNQDYALEAAHISQAAGVPVQVVWTREDDIQHDYYRPAAYHHLRAALDEQKDLVAWEHRACSPSIDGFYGGTNLPPATLAELNARDFPAYAVPNYRVEFARAESGVPVGYWRSVSNSGNQFVISSFFDEAAAESGHDPLEFLLHTMGPARKIELGGNREPIDVARRRRVIELAAEKAGWGAPLLAGVGRGIAWLFDYGSYVAQVAEAAFDAKRNRIRVHRFVCAVDCGLTINPEGVRAQMESAIHWGLAAALKSEITIERGRIQQQNFSDYEVLRIEDAPEEIEVHMVPSTASPGGCGELGVPPVAPALCNALFAATGKRIRRLPIRAEDLKS
jgi:isoquinoline 1-oxidoreductase subunit beta